MHYLKKLGKNLRVTNDKQIIKKKGKNKAAVIPPFKKCSVVIAKSYKDFQLKVLDILKATTFDDSKKPVSDYKTSIKELNLGKATKGAFAFATACLVSFLPPKNFYRKTIQSTVPTLLTQSYPMMS